MFFKTAEIIEKANSIERRCGTRDPYRVARELGIEVFTYPFKRQRGAYEVILRYRFIFLKSDLDPVMAKIVLFHEIGHDVFHRKEAAKAGIFKEFEIFNMRDSRMEYEANVFAAQMLLPDEEFLGYCKQGYDIRQIAQAMESDINLVALKGDTLIA